MWKILDSVNKKITISYPAICVRNVSNVSPIDQLMNNNINNLQLKNTNLILSNAESKVYTIKQQSGLRNKNKWTLKAVNLWIMHNYKSFY